MRAVLVGMLVAGCITAGESERRGAPPTPAQDLGLVMPRVVHAPPTLGLYPEEPLDRGVSGRV